MRKIYFWLLTLLVSFANFAQVTLNSTTGSTGYTGTNSCGSGASGSCYITFAVQNTSASPIQITQVGQWTSTSNNGNTVDLYSSTTSLSGAPGGPFSTSTPPAGWSLAASGTISGITTTGVNNVLTGLNVVIPAGATVRFAILPSGTVSYSGTGVGTASPNTFSNTGVNLLVGDAQIAGAYVGYGGTNNPRFFTGSVSFIPLAPCVGTPNAGTTLASSTAVCPLQNFNLELTGATLAQGISYQWETSSTGTGSWTPIAGATTAIITRSQTVDTYYRCAVSCANSSSTSYSTPVQVTTLPNLAGGTYTIGSGGSYPNFTAAFAAASCGVAGPVVFQVLPNSGPYNEQLEIQEIPGMSATNTITVKGNFNTLTFATTNSNQRHTLFLNGADYLRFEDLTIEAAGATAGWAVRMNSNADFNTFKRCVIKTSETSTSSSFSAFTLTTSPTSAAGTHSGTASNLLIDSCQIIGGYYGLSLNGSGTNLAAGRPSNNTVRNSTISNFYFYGVYATGQNNLVIDNNDFNRMSRSTVSTCYGVYNSGRNPGFKFTRNRIHDLGGSAGVSNFIAYPIYGTGLTGTSSNRMLIANNAIYNVNNGTSTVGGIYMSSSDTMDVYHNTIDLNVSTATATGSVWGAYFSGINFSNVNFRNNIISIASSGTGTKYCLYNASTTVLINSNNNGFHLNNPGGTSNFVAGRSATVRYTTVPDWTAATGADVNSFSSSPLFVNVSAGDVTPGAVGYNNAGAPVFSSVPTDINGAPRSATTPDIGAVEFNPTGCPAPFGVLVSNVRANSAQVTFTSLSSAVDLQWGPKGFTPGTGQGTTITTTTYTMTGLTSYAEYDLYLSGNCGSGQTSVWVGPYSFVTPVQIGWFENFSAGYNPLASSPAPLLWSELNGPAANPTVIASNTSAWMQSGWLNNGTTGAIENGVPLTSSATQGWTVTPTIDLGDVAHTTYFEWDMGVTNAGGTSGGVMGLDDTIMVIISTNNGATWNRSAALKKYHRMSGVSPFGGRYSLNLSAYTGLVKVGFYVESLTSSAAHPFAMGYDVHVDNVALTATQSPCLVPDVTIASATTTATVSWTPGAAGGQIAWGPVGFNIGSGASGANQVAASSNPYTITGLTPGTGYQVYYQTPCGATAGQWVGPFTFSTPCLSAMNGAYTVDSSGTGANNFTTLAAAVNALGVCGVSGPVTITLAGYEHTGGLNLALIPGSSATNTVTFQGAANGGSVIKGSLGQFGAVVINGTQHVTIQNLTVNAPTMSGVILTGGAEYITIHNNTILADTVSTSSTIAGIASTANFTSVTAFGNNANHITVTNNLIKGGYYGARFNGVSTTVRGSDVVFTGNTVAKAYYYGYYAYYMDDLVINDNEINNFRNTFNYGMYAYYTDEVEIKRNDVSSYYAALSLGYVNSTKPAVNSVVANNMFNASNSYGAYFPYFRYTNLYYNTFKGSSYGAYALTSTAANQSKVLDFRNNIFHGGTYAFYFSGTTMDSVTMDYNVYNHGGTTFVWYGSARASLAAWQTANPTLNANSSTNAVIFAGTNDLHVVNGGPNNIGTPIAGFTTDIDGDVRSTTTPDIGADEYTPIDYDISLEMIQGIAGCGDSNAYATVVVKNRGNQVATGYTATVELNGPNGVATQQAVLTGISIPSFSLDTVQVGPFNTYAGGAFSVQGWVTYANDQVGSNDSLSGGLRNTTSFVPATVAQTGVCFNADSVTFVANAIPGVRYAWYPTATDPVAIVDGDSLTVALDPNATYYLGYRSSIDTIVQNAGALTTTSTNITPYKTFYHDGRSQYIIYADELQTALGGANPSLISGIAFDVVSAAAQGMNDFTVKAGNIPTIPTTGYIDNTGFTTVFNTATYNTTAGWNLHSFATPVLWDGVSDFCVEVCFNNTSWTSNSTVRYETLTRKGTIDGFADAGTASGCTPGTVSATHSNNRPNFKLVAEAQACSNLRLPVTALIDSTTASAVATFAEVNPATGTFEFYANTSTGQTFDWTFGDGSSGSGDTATHSYGGPGVFTVTLIVTDSTCNTADTTTFTVTSHIGLDENALGQTLAAFPNPNTGVFTVRIAGSEAFEGQLEVLNLMGQVVSATSVDKRSASLDVNLDLSDYAKGIYMVRLSGPEGQAVLRVVVR
jgi:hypothetical protein